MCIVTTHCHVISRKYGVITLVDCGKLMQLLQSSKFLGLLAHLFVTTNAEGGERKWAVLPIFHLWHRIHADR